MEISVKSIAEYVSRVPGLFQVLWIFWILAGVTLFVATVNAVAAKASIKTVACHLSCQSPDKKYEAKRVGNHYEINEIGTDHIIRTHDQFSGDNDVKAGAFVVGPKGTSFGAAYHYGHKGKYTWIGIWDMESGNLFKQEERPGFLYDITSVLIDVEKARSQE